MPAHGHQKLPPPAQKEARDSRIVALYYQGLGWSQITGLLVDEGFEPLTPRRYQQVVAEWRAEGPLNRLSPQGLFDFVVDQLQGSMESLAVLAITTKNESIALGALNARMRVLDRLVELSRSVGAFPDLNEQRVRREWDRVAAALLRALEEDERIPEDAVDKFVGYVRDPNFGGASANAQLA